MGLFKKTSIQPETRKKDRLEAKLDRVLYTVPTTNTTINWADSVEGTLILGSTGSGKSSGPGKFIAKAMLKAGYGFCVLCAKPDERKRWLNYANETGRGNDVVLFNKDSGLKFDFLQYEMERTGEGAGDVINIVNALMSLNEQNKIHQTGGESKDEAFWNNATRRLIGRTATFLRLAGEAVNIRNMRRIVAECFRGKESDIYDLLVSKSKNPELDDLERNQAQFDLTRLINSSFFLTLFERISAHAFGVDDQEDATMVLTYFKREFPRISERTQSIIIESFNGIVEPWFNRGILKSQFSDGISADLLPENIAINKKIIIVDFPIKEFGLSGIYAATIYKTCFQAAMERREVHLEPDPTPACLWIDEYQSFCSPLTDSLFQVTARSAWVATVCITQNINNLYFVMSGNEAQARAKSLLGNLNLKFFASNADYETNTWGSDMIGKHMADVDGLQYSDKMEISKTKNQQIQYRISPDHFTTLKTGRKANNYIVETVVFKAGKVWGAANDNYAQIEFNQLAS